MNALALIVLVSLAASSPLLWILLRQRRRIERLEAQLDASSADLQRLQQSCARLAPGNVVERMISAGPQATAERKEVTVLFADIVGYTALSEKLEPPALARVLNGYFQRMCDVITEHRGHISTFLGDGILAYFGALERNPWQANDAVRAALHMQATVRAYNQQLEAEGLPGLKIGVGLHRGPGLAGMIGSRERMEYAFVGRTVNIAARVQALTRTHEADILVTEPVRQLLDPGFQLLPKPPAEVKGVAQPVVTFAVQGEATPA